MNLHMSHMIRTAILGASGYVGGELMRLIAAHPAMQVHVAFAASNSGQPVSSVHPHLALAYPNTSRSSISAPTSGSTAPPNMSAGMASRTPGPTCWTASPTACPNSSATRSRVPNASPPPAAIRPLQASPSARWSRPARSKAEASSSMLLRASAAPGARPARAATSAASTETIAPMACSTTATQRRWSWPPAPPSCLRRT